MCARVPACEYVCYLCVCGLVCLSGGQQCFPLPVPVLFPSHLFPILQFPGFHTFASLEPRGLGAGRYCFISYLQKINLSIPKAAGPPSPSVCPSMPQNCSLAPGTATHRLAPGACVQYPGARSFFLHHLPAAPRHLGASARVPMATLGNIFRSRAVNSNHHVPVTLICQALDVCSSPCNSPVGLAS